MANRIMGWIINGSPGHLPGIEWEEGRLWTPSSHLPDEVGGRGSSAMVCSPLAKYVFVKPRAGGNYTAQEFVDHRDDTSDLKPASLNAVAGYVFWLGDSSSCGGTEIQQATTDPMQAFLRDVDNKSAFARAQITKGGFFLLGDRQGVAQAATEIKKIVFDCQLDFIVLGIHHKPGETAADINLTAFRHLVASIRWDVGAKKPIILMLGARGPIVGAGNENIHLMGEAARGNLFVGDITDQNTAAKQTVLLDRAGFLSLNWWPMVAFVPNAENGEDVRTTMGGMANRLFHPLLIPASGSGCPFNTTRNLTAAEINSARTDFLTPDVFPLAESKVRTTSAWFWDFDTMKNNARVNAWESQRFVLTGMTAYMDYMSDMQVVFESIPSWVGHPVFDHDFAMEFRMENRSMNNVVLWDRETRGPGTVPDLHGAKDQDDGWLTVITPFELSKTASKFYGKQEGDNRSVPVIPTWAKFTWLREMSQDSLDDPGSDWLGIPGMPSPGDMIDGLLDLLDDGLDWIGGIFGLPTNTEGFTKWSAGLNQPHVAIYGKPQYPDSEEDQDSGVVKLNLESAPFAIQIQTWNFKMNGGLGFVWPARVFNIVPIAIDKMVADFDPVCTPAGLTFWDDLGFNAVGSGGTSPLRFDMGEVPLSEMQKLIEDSTNLKIVPFDELKPLLDHKGDFPPMLDQEDTYLNRDFSNQLARIDITHPHIIRAHERDGGGPGPGPGPAPFPGPYGRAIQNWPLIEDREILITQGFNGQEWDGYVCDKHDSLDLVYTDHSQTYSTPILAVGDGVAHLGYCGDCGPWIEIVHQVPPLPSLSTITSKYLHLGQRFVEEGEVVRAGQTIGSMGSEGVGNSLHLHFQLFTVDDCNGGHKDPCGIMPRAQNGTSPPCDPLVPGPDTDIATMICQAVEQAIASLNADPYFTDTQQDGQRIRKSSLARAIAKGESGFNQKSQNCYCYPLDLYDISKAECEGMGGTLYSHVGLFQIQNPAQIEADIIASIISGSSVITNDENCPGIRVAQDYKIAYPNILSFLRMSSMVTNVWPWQVYNDGHTYLEMMDAGCPPETWASP